MTRPLAIAALVFGVFLLHGLNDPELHHAVLDPVAAMQSHGAADHGMGGESHPSSPVGATCAVVCAAAVLAVITLATRLDRLAWLSSVPRQRWHRSLVRGPEPPVPRFV